MLPITKIISILKPCKSTKLHECVNRAHLRAQAQFCRFVSNELIQYGRHIYKTHHNNTQHTTFCKLFMKMINYI